MAHKEILSAAAINAVVSDTESLGNYEFEAVADRFAQTNDSRKIAANVRARGPTSLEQVVPKPPSVGCLDINHNTHRREPLK
ncbi:unnamed protein product, partial [Iphiclides podalirius]